MGRCITMVVREGERERGGGERDGNGSRIWKEGGAAEERGGGGMPGGGATGEGDRGIWVGVRGRFFFWREKGELEMEAAFLGNRNERWTPISVASCPSIFSAPGAATGIFGMYR